MDLETLLGQLPPEHASVIRLRISGHPDDLIADALGIDTAGVPAVARQAGYQLVHVAVATANAQD